MANALRIALIGLVLNLMPVSASADPAQLGEALREYFKPLRLLPVVVPSGYAVGDVYDFPSMQLVSQANECFDKLQVRQTPITLGQGANAQGWFGELTATLLKAIGLKAGATGSARYAVRFDDAMVTEVSRTELSRKLRPECSDLRAILESDSAHAAGQRFPISRIVAARVSLFVTTSSAADAEFAAKDVQTILGVPTTYTKLDLDAAAKAGWGQTSGWLLVSEKVSPVAFVPVVIPRRALGGPAVVRKTMPMDDIDDPINGKAFGDYSDELAPVVFRRIGVPTR